MGDWESVFREIDDDYLAGISNKGIVKRAHKDREGTLCQVSDEVSESDLHKAFSTEDGVAVKVGEETVRIRLPLGESTCSCPSRSICRHVILGILTLQEIAKTSVRENVTEAAQEPAIETAKASARETVKTSAKESGEKNAGQQPAELPEKSEMSGDSMLEKVLQQIAEYPLEKLQKSLGTKRLRELISRARSGQGAQIAYSSVVTVQPVAQAMTVRLLFPLEFSTCSCHKKEFCVHKAEAVLWCKLDAGQVSPDGLEQEEGGASDYDMGQVQDAASQMRIFLEELLDTGLSRTPQDVLERMERLATVSHNAKLPDFEGDWRALQDSYKGYLKRVASLRVREIMERITGLYRRAELLGQAQNGLAVLELGGVFRTEYVHTADLELVGIAIEHFKTRSGYEGETVYFLEENTKEWYTYTQARPVFYDHDAGKKRYVQETPWGLQISVRELAFWHIHLEQAKFDNKDNNKDNNIRRLSSGRETKGRLLHDRRGKNVLTADTLGKWYDQDFAHLFREQFTQSAQTRLVFIRPASCEKAVFVETEQKLYMNLYDSAGKMVVVEIVYSKDEEEGIRYLEKISNENLPCFFGKIYLRDGRIRMYPVAVFGQEELVEKKLDEKNPDKKDLPGIKMSCRENVLEQLLSDVENLLEDLCQSGFDTAHDSTLEALNNMTKRTALYGMAQLSEGLSRLGSGLAMRRHQPEKKEDHLAGIYTKLNQYIHLCKEKIEYDRCVSYYEEVSSKSS